MGMMAHEMSHVILRHGTLQFFSDHPTPTTANAIEAEIRGLPQREYSYQTGISRAPELPPFLHWPEAFLRAVPAAQVAGRGPVLPTAWDLFRGPRFSVPYPRDWKPESDGTSSGVRISPAHGLIQQANSSPRLASGAVLSYFSPTFGRADLDIATLELISYLHTDSRALQLSATPRRNVRLNGAEGMLSWLLNRSPRAGPETDILLTLIRPTCADAYR